MTVGADVVAGTVGADVVGGTVGLDVVPVGVEVVEDMVGFEVTGEKLDLEDLEEYVGVGGLRVGFTVTWKGTTRENEICPTFREYGLLRQSLALHCALDLFALLSCYFFPTTNSFNSCGSATLVDRPWELRTLVKRS